MKNLRLPLNLTALAMLPLIATACAKEPEKADAPVPEQAEKNVVSVEPPATSTVPASKTPAPEEVTANSKTIPASLQGKWAKDKLGCTQPSEMTVTFLPGEIRYWESVGKVTVVSRTASEIKIAADYEGEGQKWTRTNSYSLSADGKTMTADGITRIKCE